MNKKILAGLLAVILVLALVLVGCSKPSQGGPDQFASSGTGVEDWDDIIYFDIHEVNFKRLCFCIFMFNSFLIININDSQNKHDNMQSK